MTIQAMKISNRILRHSSHFELTVMINSARTPKYCTQKCTVYFENNRERDDNNAWKIYLKQFVMRGNGRESKYVSILADEAVDISNKEHLSVVRRFVNSEKNIREQAVGFYLCEGGTAGVAIKELILQARVING